MGHRHNIIEKSLTPHPTIWVISEAHSHNISSQANYGSKTYLTDSSHMGSRKLLISVKTATKYTPQYKYIIKNFCTKHTFPREIYDVISYGLIDAAVVDLVKKNK